MADLTVTSESLTSQPAVSCPEASDAKTHISTCAKCNAMTAWKKSGDNWRMENAMSFDKAKIDSFLSNCAEVQCGWTSPQSHAWVDAEVTGYKRCSNGCGVERIGTSTPYDYRDENGAYTETEPNCIPS